jgi:hypothetical protein
VSLPGRLPPGIVEAVETMRAIGIDVGSYRLSLYGLFSTLVVGVLLYIAVRVVMRAIKWLLRRNPQIDATQRLLTEKLIAIALFVFALLLGIDLLGIDLTALAVFSGAAGLAVGFGLQKTVGNLIAGIILLMDRSIKPGDIIVVGDGSAMGGPPLPGGMPNVGRVAKIGVRAVNVITRDGRKHLIPNELLMTQAVENWSYASPEVRVRMRVPVAYESDLRRAQRIIVETANRGWAMSRAKCSWTSGTVFRKRGSPSPIRGATCGWCRGTSRRGDASPLPPAGGEMGRQNPFCFARSMPSRMMRFASSTSPQPSSFTHLPGSRSL